jgi:haloalkane dehalogenase
MAGEISAQDPYERHRAHVLDSRIAYVDTGEGDPIVFLHGNPTSSYLWRNVIPHLEGLARCLAPDLIGMGDSGPSSSGYRFTDHQRYLDAWLELLNLGDRVTFVVHDWGSALAFHWAQRHPERVRGIAYMEAIVMPVTWEQWPPRRVFERLRSPEGDSMVLDGNYFVEVILARSVLRGLGEAEMSVYRRPYETRESRLPTLVWPREIPIEGQPEDVTHIVREYGEWLAQADVPKLFINADPGAILVGDQRDFCRRWPNQREVSVPGSHFIQEDSPHEIGEAIADWYREIAR